MSKFKLLNVAIAAGKGGSSKTAGVTVDGDTLKFGKKLSDAMRLGSEISLGITGEGANSRVYFLPAGTDGGTSYPVNGNSGGNGARATMRYMRNKNIINALRLENGEYPVLYDNEENLYYLEFDATKPERTNFDRKPRNPRAPKVAGEESAETLANKAKAQEIKDKQAAKAAGAKPQTADKK